MIAQQPIDRVRLVLALGHRRIAGCLLLLDMRHLVFRRRDLPPHFGIFFRLLDLLMGELTRRDGVDPLDALGHVFVCDPFHFERVHADELGNILEGQHCIVDQQKRGRL